MPKYTPPMERLRREYLAEIAYRGFADLYAEEFDRALAAHDARVKAEAWDEGKEALALATLPGSEPLVNPYRAASETEGNES